jgi:hypothetical protein
LQVLARIGPPNSEAAILSEVTTIGCVVSVHRSGTGSFFGRKVVDCRKAREPKNVPVPLIFDVKRVPPVNGYGCVQLSTSLYQSKESQSDGTNHGKSHQRCPNDELIDRYGRPVEPVENRRQDERRPTAEFDPGAQFFRR